jgi:heptosyltransferase-2
MNKDILIIGPSWIGDTVMAQSLFKLLKQEHPESAIDILAPTRTIILASRMPEIRHAIEAPFTHFKFSPIKHYVLAKQLRQNNYAQAIILPNSFKSAITPWLAGIKKRTGWLGETRYFVLNDIRHLDKNKYPLMIERYIALGLPANTVLSKPYPYPKLEISIESRHALLKQYTNLNPSRPILAMCIGAEYGPSKCWPAEYFATVANQKIKDGWDIWLVGSNKESENAKKIIQLSNQQCQDLTGRFSLLEMIDLFSLVSGVITNDTGLMHIAAALNKPLLALYGSSSPNFTPPLCENAIILKLNMQCQPCFKRTCSFNHYDCMKNLKPEIVLAEISHWQEKNLV